MAVCPGARPPSALSAPLRRPHFGPLPRICESEKSCRREMKRPHTRPASRSTFCYLHPRSSAPGAMSYCATRSPRGYTAPGAHHSLATDHPVRSIGMECSTLTSILRKVARVGVPVPSPFLIPGGFGINSHARGTRRRLPRAHHRDPYDAHYLVQSRVRPSLPHDRTRLSAG